MDLQREREAFDQYFKEKYQEFHNEVFDENGDDRAIIGYSFAWSAWQAAKAQAVPEGFVLVPKEPTDAMLFAASGRDIVAEHYGDENIMWPELRETWNAMLEAARGGNE